MNSSSELRSIVEQLRVVTEYQEKVLCIADELVSALEPLGPIVERCYLWPRILGIVAAFKEARIPVDDIPTYLGD
jgi:hypothetical protein